MVENFTFKGRLQMSKQFSKNLGIALFLFIIPTLFCAQMLLPKFIQIFSISLRLIIAPILIFIFLHSRFNFRLLIFFVIYIVLLSLVSPITKFNYYLTTFLSLLGCIAFYKLGAYLKAEEKNNKIFIFLAYGVNLFNIVTLVFYYLLLKNYINIDSFYKLLGNKTVVEIFRFSLGNAIEGPFVITTMLYSVIMLSNGKNVFLFSTSLNFIVTLISQSRLLVIIAFLIMLKEFLRSKQKNQLIIIFIILLLSPFLISEFGDTLISYIHRLSGNDRGSAKDRMSLLNIFLSNLTIITISIGRGLTSSPEVLRHIIGFYRGLESLLLQLIFEIGILGTFLFLINVYGLNLRPFVIKKFSLIIFLIYIQLFVSTTVFTGMPIIFFLLGICSVSSTMSSKMIITFRKLKIGL